MQNRRRNVWKFCKHKIIPSEPLSFRFLFRSTLTQFVLQAGFQAVKRALRSVSVRNNSPQPRRANCRRASEEVGKRRAGPARSGPEGLEKSRPLGRNPSRETFYPLYSPLRSYLAAWPYNGRVYKVVSCAARLFRTVARSETVFSTFYLTSTQ